MKTIKDMPEHSRRREKLRQGGAAALTDEDLVAAFELARRHLLNDTVKIQCAEDVIPLLADIVSKTQEHFVCIAHVEFHGKILFWFGGRRRISKRILWTRFAEMMDDLASA
jgi:DNA repair protein RadC